MTVAMALRRVTVAAANIVTGTFTANAADTVNRTVYTFNSQAIGTAPTGANRRFVVVAAYGLTTSDNSTGITGITIGGSSGTEVINTQHSVDSGETACQAIFVREVSSGTTADIVVTFANTVVGAGVMIWKVETGAGGLGVIATSSGIASASSATASAASANGDFAIGAYGAQNSGNPTAGTSTMTESAAVDTNTNEWFSGWSEVCDGSAVLLEPSDSPSGKSIAQIAVFTPG